MGPLEITIIEKLTEQFNPEVLQVTNESYLHSVPAFSAAPSGDLCKVGRRAKRAGACLGTAYLHGVRMV